MGTTSGYITRNQDLIINMDAGNFRSYTSGSTTCECLVSTVSGTLEGGTSFTSEYKGGWVFGGSNDYLNLGNRPNINPELDSFTVNIFFKINSSSSSSSIIASKGNGSDSDIGWLLYYSNTNDILTVRCNGNNTTSERAAQHISITKGQVYMVTMVINRDDNTIKGYLNGSNVGWVNGNYAGTFSGNSISGFGSITNSDDFLVGERPQLNLPMFGTIYLFQTYNFALSEAQVYRNFRFFGGRYDLSVPPPPPSFFDDYSFEFDGTDDYIDIGLSSPPELNLVGDMSISAWIKIDTLVSGARVIVCDCNAGANTSQFCFEVNRTSGKLSVLANGGSVALTSSTSLSTGIWYHVLMTRSGSAGNWDYNIYLDGVNDGSANTPNNPHTQQGCAIGRFGHSSSGYFSGLIDEVGIWNVELNGTQVNNIYNLGTPSDLTSLNPVAWYRMGDNGIYKSPQWLLPSNENKDKASNYSMSFDGTNDEIVVPYNSNLQFGKTQAYSVSCWIYAPSYVISSKMVLGTGNWATSAYLKNDTHSGGLYSVMWVMGGTWPTSAGYHITVKSGFVLSQATWHNIIITYDGSELGAGLKMYVDGGTPTVSTDNWGANTQNSLNSSDFRISLAAATGWPGYMGEISVWRSELTSTHIAEIYNSGTPVNLNALPTAPVPTTWWNLGENAIFKDPQWLLPNNENKDKFSNYSMSFDGTDDYIDCGTGIGDSLGDNYTGDLSLSIWFKADTSGAQEGLFEIGNVSTQRDFYLSTWSNKMYFSINNQSWYKEVAFTDTTSWHHILMVYKSGSATDSKFYLDGSEVDSGSGTGSFPATADMDFAGMGTYIGRYHTQYFGGNIDDVALFNNDQSANVATIYNSGVPTDLSAESGLVGYWRMGEGSYWNATNWTVPDQIGSNDGTSANMDIYDRIGDAPGSSGNTVSYNMDIYDRVGEAPGSTNNALSYNMVLSGRTTDVPT